MRIGKMKNEFINRRFTIGGDPEFVLRNYKGDCLVQARDYKFFNKVGEDHKIGRDGNSYPVEIRPSPSYINKVHHIIGDIENIIKKLAIFCRNENLMILCGAESYGVPIGGHIHFGGRDICTQNNGNERLNHDIINKRCANQEHLINVLDLYLTPPMNLLLSDKEITKRSNNGYGRLHAYRKQRWGIEYRTPYSFIASPIMTRGFFALACLLAHHYRSIKIPDRDLDTLYRYGQAMKHDNKIRHIGRDIYKKTKPRILKMMSIYSPNPTFNSYITSLFSLIEQNKLINKDVIANYGYKEAEAYPLITLKRYNEKLHMLSKMIHDKFQNEKFTMNIELVEQYNGGNKRMFFDNRYKVPTSTTYNIQSVGWNINDISDVWLGFSYSTLTDMLNKPRYRSWMYKYIKERLKK